MLRSVRHCEKLRQIVRALGASVQVKTCEKPQDRTSASVSLRDLDWGAMTVAGTFERRDLSTMEGSYRVRHAE